MGATSALGPRFSLQNLACVVEQPFPLINLGWVHVIMLCNLVDRLQTLDGGQCNLCFVRAAERFSLLCHDSASFAGSILNYIRGVLRKVGTTI